MTCKKCAQRGKPKIYEVRSGPYVHLYDVERAISLAAKLPIEEADPNLLKDGLLVNGFDEEHLDHVDMEDPILFGLESMPDDAVVNQLGVELTGAEARKRALAMGLESNLFLVFLDGSHRLARAVRDKRPVIKARILEEKETKRCLIGSYLTAWPSMKKRRTKVG